MSHGVRFGVRRLLMHRSWLLMHPWLMLRFRRRLGRTLGLGFRRYNLVLRFGGSLGTGRRVRCLSVGEFLAGILIANPGRGHLLCHVVLTLLRVRTHTVAYRRSERQQPR
jgi:hypothetical protein